MPQAPACSGAPGRPGGAGARQAGWADDRGDAGAGARCRMRRPVPVPPGGQAAPGPARLGGLTTGGMLVRGRVAAGACSGAPGRPGGAGARPAGWADDRGDAGAGARCRRRRPVPGPPGHRAAPGPAQHLPCRQPTQPGGPRRRLASRGHRNRPAPAATRPRTSISPVVSPPRLAGPGAARCPGGTGTGRRLRQRAPAPASPLSSAHPAWRAPAPPGVPGAPEHPGACGNAPPHQHFPCRQPTQPGGPRRRLASRGHRNRPAPAATRPAPASPLSSAHPAGRGPGAAWPPGGTGTGRRPRPRAPAPASPLSPAHPAWRAPPPPGVPGAPEHPGACGNAPPHQHPPCRQPTPPGGPRRRLASRGHRNRPAPPATRPRTSISPVVSPPGLAGPGAAWPPGGTGTGRRLRQRAPAPASPLSSAHPAWRAPAPPGLPGAPEQAGACGNAPPHQHLPCRQPTQPGGPRHRPASRGHRNRPAPPATHPRTSISHVVSPPSLAGPGAAWRPGGTGTGRRLRQRTPAPASPLSSAHPAWRAPAPPGIPGAPEQAGAPGNAPPHQHPPCRQPTQPGGPRRRLVSRGHRNRPAPAATRPRTSISPVVSPPGLAGPGAAWPPGGTGTGRRHRQRTPAPASPLQHPPCRQPTQPGGPRRRLVSRRHRNRPAPAATRPRTSISPVVSPPSLAGPGAAWCPGGTGTGRRLRQRTPAPASPLSSAHPAWWAPAPPGVPGAPEQAGACGNAPPHQHLPCRPSTPPGHPGTAEPTVPVRAAPGAPEHRHALLGRKQAHLVYPTRDAPAPCRNDPKDQRGEGAKS